MLGVNFNKYKAGLPDQYWRPVIQNDPTCRAVPCFSYFMHWPDQSTAASAVTVMTNGTSFEDCQS